MADAALAKLSNEENLVQYSIDDVSRDGVWLVRVQELHLRTFSKLQASQASSNVFEGVFYGVRAAKQAIQD